MRGLNLHVLLNYSYMLYILTYEFLTWSLSTPTLLGDILPERTNERHHERNSAHEPTINENKIFLFISNKPRLPSFTVSYSFLVGTNFKTTTFLQCLSSCVGNMFLLQIFSDLINFYFNRATTIKCKNFQRF